MQQAPPLLVTHILKRDLFYRFRYGTLWPTQANQMDFRSPQGRHSALSPLFQGFLEASFTLCPLRKLTSETLGPLYAFKPLSTKRWTAWDSGIETCFCSNPIETQRHELWKLNELFNQSTNSTKEHVSVEHRLHHRRRCCHTGTPSPPPPSPLSSTEPHRRPLRTSGPVVAGKATSTGVDGAQAGPPLLLAAENGSTRRLNSFLKPPQKER